MATDSDDDATFAISGPGAGAEPLRNAVLDRMRVFKREALDREMGKGESWTTKLINDESGVRLADLPRLLRVLGLKVVAADALCVDPEIARAYDAIARKAVNSTSSLLTTDEQ